MFIVCQFELHNPADQALDIQVAERARLVEAAIGGTKSHAQNLIRTAYSVSGAQTMRWRLILAAVISVFAMSALAFVAPALADEYFMVQSPTMKECNIVSQKLQPEQHRSCGWQAFRCQGRSRTAYEDGKGVSRNFANHAFRLIHNADARLIE